MSALDQLVPEGYKTSEVGIIPERWNAVPAKEVVEFFGGYGFSSRLASNDGTKWLKIANVGINEIKWGAVSYLPEYLLQSFKEYSLAENDVVMALTRPLLGDQLKVAKIESKDLPALLNQRVAKLKPKSSNNLNYIYYSIQREDFIAAMNLAMAGTDPPNIGTNALGKIFVALPEDEKEQTAIANALSDVDALLTELEKLIAKKQAIKTATMQQLLTGKTRLPQFATYTEGEKQGQPKGTKPSELGEIPENWDVSKLGDLGKFKNGINKDADSFGHGSPFVNLMDVFGKPKISGIEDFGLINSTALEKKEYSISKGDVLFIRSSVKPSGVGLTSVALANIDNAVYSGFLIRFRSNKKLDDNFKIHCFYDESFRKRIIAASTVSANTNINQDALKEIQIAYPTDIDEQIAIATILSDMDNEIQTLEQRLAKTSQIKQGMMQELLTGRTRLPFDNE